MAQRLRRQGATLLPSGVLAQPLVLRERSGAPERSGAENFFPSFGEAVARGRELLARSPRWRERAARTERVFARCGAAMALGFRFAYGLRSVSPVVIGMSRMPPARFLVLNHVGGLVWSVSIALVAYHSTRAAAFVLGDLRRYEPAVVAGLLLLATTAWLVHLLRNRRRSEPARSVR